MGDRDVSEKIALGVHTGAGGAMGGLGRRDYEAVVPSGSFLHVDDFNSVEHMAQRLMEVRWLSWRVELFWGLRASGLVGSSIYKALSIYRAPVNRVLHIYICIYIHCPYR